MSSSKTASPSPLAVIRTKYHFRWDTLDVIIAGKSSIDSGTGFNIRTADEAERFLVSYGYDPQDPIENAELLGNFREALNFIRKYFLQPENADGLRLEVPRKLLELSDVRDLFLMANLHYPGQMADGQGQSLRDWSCAVLKVMHTIAHLDKDLRSPYFSDIQKQIFDRFYRVVHRDSNKRLYIGGEESDPCRIDLVAFETKPKKSRESTLLKLLHKSENVAEELFDRVGLRFVTETRLDALRVVKYLKDNMIIMAPNIKPSRSRNTLVELDSFKDVLLEYLPSAEEGRMSEAELIAHLENGARVPEVNPDNPHSSEFYRAIQFTCRQLIKLKNPLYSHLREVKQSVKTLGAPEEVIKGLEQIDLKYVQREVRFFYPFEVQVMDRVSAEENEKGRSAHSEYKRQQVQTALKRVMGALIHGGRAQF